MTGGRSARKKMNVSDKDLAVIRSKLAVMGKLASNMFSEAVLALSEADRETARATIALDSRVDAMEEEIEDLCLVFLGLKAPKALDLRFAVAVTKIINEVERIADHATALCREGLSRRLGPIWAKDPDFGLMARISGDMVNRSLDSFMAFDDRAYAGLLEEDKRVGQKQRLLNERLVAQVAKDPEKALDIISLINVIRRVERVADHAKNISMMVPYVTRGVLVRHNQEAGQDADNDD
jgi:phosphate transport system protein